MLTEKDYCDLELTTILQKVGMSIKNVVATSPHGATKWYSNVTLYEAQKWLREEKNIEVNASFDKKDDGWIAFIQRLDYPDLCGTDILSTIYNTYEAALNQSIKEAINVLKEDGVTKQEIQNE